MRWPGPNAAEDLSAAIVETRSGGGEYYPPEVGPLSPGEPAATAFAIPSAVLIAKIGGNPPFWLSGFFADTPTDTPSRSAACDTVASPDFTYDDLIDDLVRYGGSEEAYWRAEFPELTPALVVAAMTTADECPRCLTRFINRRGATHAPGCLIAEGVYLSVVR